MSDRTVVFVCLHGAAKSLIAATLFQRLADERGLAVRSTFAGTEPDPAIQPNVVARLLEEGVDVRPLRPRRVTRDELASAWRVVRDRKSTRLNSSHGYISYAVFCLKKKKKKKQKRRRHA